MLLAACMPMLEGREDLVVFAASSLTDAFGALAEAYEAQNPGVRVVPNYAGSSQLAVQLINNAPADVFASANPAQMQYVAEAGLLAGDPVVFATNRLVVLVPADNPAGIETFADLAEPGVLVVLAVPGVPIREYTDQAAAQLGTDFTAGLRANIVSEEDNVRQVAARIALGEADAGVVYATDVTPDISDSVRAIPITADITALYPIAALQGASPRAEDFIAFVLSDAGQVILADFSFSPPP
ncbi:MAG: molybdate ABC transporter substrate-binding protein [Chloroflexi bacterium]|nr:molybdate ABC transporter substrate-binding protein [Chloroflexota bacterium]